MKQDPDRNAFAQLVESLYQADARKLLLVADRFQKEDWSNSPFKGVYPGSLSVPLTYGFRGGRGRLKGGATAPGRPSRLHGKE